MGRYALIRNGAVQSILDTDKDKSEFPDIEEFLVPCDDTVKCNQVYDGQSFVVSPPFFPDVTARQMRQALILSGVSLSMIDDALNSLPEPTKSLAKVEWEYSNMVQRNRPLVAQVSQMLGWNNAQLDALWLLAGSL